MMERMVHRGPDDAGLYETPLVSLAMQRLSIVDLTTGGQPVFNEDRSISCVLNGEIYNHVALRNDLEKKGHAFRSHHSDTEVIVHLYEEYGRNWPKYVNGMFGAAVWDERHKVLSLYRDRIGKKPLYFAVAQQRLIFGSEIKALIAHPDVSREWDYAGLGEYFKWKHIRAPKTAFRQIRQLLPGCGLEWKNGEINFFQYWQVDFTPTGIALKDSEVADRLYDLLADAVKLRMECDVPYGAYLSGGVDSSAVVAIMARQTGKPVKTFCLGYSDLGEGAQSKGKSQDLYHAREMAALLGTDHHELIIDARQFADNMPLVTKAFDEPFSGTVSTFFLSILIHRHVKVALSGDGADELFGSYLAHRLAMPIAVYTRLSAQGKTELSALSLEERQLLVPFDSPAQFQFLKQVAHPDMGVWRERLQVFRDAEWEALLAEDFRQAAGRQTVGGADPFYGRSSAKDPLNRALEMDQLDLLPNEVLPFVDRLSMAHSIEVRSPYLDYRIIELADQLPGEMKIRGKVVKHIHKQAVARLLPETVINRPKEGFVQPVYTWMHGPLRKWARDLLAELPRNCFQDEAVRQICGRFDQGDETVNAKIWNLVCFSLWVREYRQ